MLPPSHKNRSLEDIVGERLYFDSSGYLYRAMSWIGYAKRNRLFPSLIYACIEGRLGIEYLLFEELVISTGAKLSRADYERCVRDGKLEKAINRISPDYLKLQEFVQALVSVEPRAPRLISWEPKSLMKAWGTLSELLHWSGSRTETVEDPTWAGKALATVKLALNPIWEKLSSAPSGLMHPSNMNPEVRELWEQFRTGTMTLETVVFQLNYLRPVLAAKYA